jgi:hypothetical protein
MIVATDCPFCGAVQSVRSVHAVFEGEHDINRRQCIQCERTWSEIKDRERRRGQTERRKATRQDRRTN